MCGSPQQNNIQPAVDQAGPNLEAATKANVKIQAALLREASTVIAGLVKGKKLRVWPAIMTSRAASPAFWNR